MVITIPQDFSANAATLTDDQPKQMELNYETNPGTNYIASKLSETAMKEIQASVREEVTKTYAETMFDQLTEVGDGMQEAADGAAKSGMEPTSWRMATTPSGRICSFWRTAPSPSAAAARP